ncbi:MAG: toll/interleukin-1 receptor domain-containing protein [Chloroflexi bacterium]|nr:toll/interleukin-1 receptor domain-containing protein [Chloroflexota bacterium]
MLVFISYETTTGLSYASNIKEALRKINISAFVADEDIPKGAEWKKIIDKAISNCKYLVVIMTILAIKTSDEVKREIEIAKILQKNIIPCKPRRVDRFFTSMLPLVSELQQVDFDGKEDLADQIVTVITNQEQGKTVVRSGTQETRITEPPSEASARMTEYHNLSSAVIALMVDNNLTRIPNSHNFAGGVAYNDMTVFPDSNTSVANKAYTGYTGVGTPKAGYVLYAHDKIGADTTTFERVNYVTEAKARYYYTCEADGTIRQFSDAAMTTEYTD